MQRVVWLTMTVLLSLNSCAIQWHNVEQCSPQPGGDAFCDNFLTKNPQHLNVKQWKDLQAKWGVTQCMSDQNSVWLKAAGEKACTVYHCAYSEADTGN